MTRGQIRKFVDSSSVQRIREMVDLLQKLQNHVPVSELPRHDVALLLDLRDHESFLELNSDRITRLMSTADAYNGRSRKRAGQSLGPRRGEDVT